MYTRGKEHLEGLRNGTASNCLMIHNNVHHGGSKTNHFVMEATGTLNKPLDRKFDESIRLKFLIDLASFLIHGLNVGATPYLELHSMPERRKRNV